MVTLQKRGDAYNVTIRIDDGSNIQKATLHIDDVI